MKRTKQRWTALCLALLLLIPFASLFTAQAQGKAFPSGLSYEALSAHMEEAYAAQGNDNGFMTAVFDTEGTIYEGYFGYANKESGRQMEETTVVDWGSVSKLLVWLSAMQLKERGLLDLNDDLRPYFPDGLLKKLSFDDPITMLDLMNHTAGFEDVFANMTVSPRDHLMGINELVLSSEKPLTLEEYLLKSQPAQNFRPGETVTYSNYGCALAAYVIERITGEASSAYARSNIFIPLQMNDTALSNDLSDNPSVQKRFQNLWFYNANGSAVKDTEVAAWRVLNCYPAGHCTSTLHDLETFAQALLSHDERLLSAEGFTEWFSPSRTYTGTDVPRNSHGLWWLSTFGVPIVGHNGNSLASAMLLLDPNSGVGYVALANEANNECINAVAHLLFGSYVGEPGTTAYYTCNSRWPFHGLLRAAYPFMCYHCFTKEDFATAYINVLENKVEYLAADYFYNPTLNRLGVFGYAIWLLLSMGRSMPGASTPLFSIGAFCG